MSLRYQLCGQSQELILMERMKVQFTQSLNLQSKCTCDTEILGNNLSCLSGNDGKNEGYYLLKASLFLFQVHFLLASCKSDDGGRPNMCSSGTGKRATKWIRALHHLFTQTCFQETQKKRSGILTLSRTTALASQQRRGRKPESLFLLLHYYNYF